MLQGSTVTEKMFFSKKQKRKIILPNSDDIKQQLLTYKSDISLNEYKNKLYIDPEYSNPPLTMLINGMYVSGNYEVQSYTERGEHAEKYIVKLIDKNSNNFIEFFFDDISTKMQFVENIHSKTEIEQVHCNSDGINISDNINNNVLFTKNPIDANSISKTSAAVIIGSLTTYLFMKRKK